MKQFSYVITDKEGIHARPVTITCDGPDEAEAAASLEAFLKENL